MTFSWSAFSCAVSPSSLDVESPELLELLEESPEFEFELELELWPELLCWFCAAPFTTLATFLACGSVLELPQLRMRMKTRPIATSATAPMMIR